MSSSGEKIAAAVEEYENWDQQYAELDGDNPWFGHYRDIILEERLEAKKRLREAVAELIGAEP